MASSGEAAALEERLSAAAVGSLGLMSAIGIRPPRKKG
jgi:hypothetical protein